MTSIPKSRAEEQFNAACSRLKKSILKSSHGYLGQVNCPDLDRIEDVEVKAAELEKMIENVIRLQREHNETKKVAQSAKATLRHCFRAMYPFTRVFLNVAKLGAAVTSLECRLLTLQVTVLNPYGLLCGGLLVLTEVLHP